MNSPYMEVSYCEYTGTDLPSKVGITVYRFVNQNPEQMYRHIVDDISSEAKSETIKGLGNEAHVWFEGDNGTIVVRNGNVIFLIGIQHSTYRDDQWERLKRVSVKSLRTLAETALPRTNKSK